jgi:hypothetical protein
MDHGSRIIIGKVSRRRVRLAAIRPGVRNSWRPILRGKLTADDGGCRLVGGIGWHPLVRAFTAVCLGLLATFFGRGLASALSSRSSGDTTGELHALAFLAISLAFGVFFVVLASVASRWGRKDEEYLREWLVHKLEVS